MSTYPNWSEADYPQRMIGIVLGYYRPSEEFMRRWGIEETIDIECEVVEPKQLEQ